MRLWIYVFWFGKSFSYCRLEFAAAEKETLFYQVPMNFVSVFSFLLLWSQHCYFRVCASSFSFYTYFWTQNEEVCDNTSEKWFHWWLNIWSKFDWVGWGFTLNGNFLLAGLVWDWNIWNQLLIYLFLKYN